MTHRVPDGPLVLVLGRHLVPQQAVGEAGVQVQVGGRVRVHEPTNGRVLPQRHHPAVRGKRRHLVVDVGNGDVHQGGAGQRRGAPGGG